MVLNLFSGATVGPPLYQTAVNQFLYIGGDDHYYNTIYISEPAGSNYLNFQGFGGFIEAYDSYDGTYHYTNPSWYNLGTGTTIDVLYYY
ncbi:MAG TPA: hypothetical protein VK536_05370 [Candidatus Limnocylindrales bacterium]|nr:hypothetical protein [Candidatus Limnocylindrales bacterium]